MESEEVEFLRDQVQRLNAVVQHYQEKYLPLEEREKANLHKPGDQGAPWLTSKSLLSPLMVEYDRQLSALRQQVNTYKSEQQDTSIKIERLVNENNRLHNELKSSLRGQLDVSHDGGLGLGFASDITDQQLVENLQRQIALLTEEKNSAIQMWQETVQEMDRLTNEHRDVLNESKVQTATHQAIQEKGAALLEQNQELLGTVQKLEMANQHLQQVVSSQSQEQESHRDQLRKAKSDTRTANIQLTELRNTLEQLKHEIQLRERETNQAKDREESADSRLTQLQAVIGDMEQRFTDMTEENSKLTNSRRELEDQMQKLHSRNAKVEQREYEALAQVRDSIQMVENAILEKDQALVREQQKAQELSRLQEALSKLINEAGKRTRQEVDNVRRQCNINIAKLMEEIQAMETENAEKQAELDRAIREKRAVEQELETLYKEGSNGPEDSQFRQLQDRVTSAERLRSEAMLQVESLEKAIKRMQLSHEEEKIQNQIMNDQLKQRLNKLTKESENLSEERLKLLEEIDGIKNTLTFAQKDMASGERKHLTEMASLQQEMFLLKTEYEARIESIEESSRQSSKELRVMLTSHQRVSAKWREEAKTLTHKFESKVKELRSEISVHKKRAEELTLQLAQQRELYLQTEANLAEQVEFNHKQSKQLTIVERRAADVSKQLADQLARERRIQQDRKYLQRELDKSKLEAARINRVPDVMRMSDLDVGTTEPLPHRTNRTLATDLLARTNGEYRRGSRSSKSGSSDNEPC